jgi:hypothetical protein
MPKKTLTEKLPKALSSFFAGLSPPLFFEGRPDSLEGGLVLFLSLPEPDD